MGREVAREYSSEDEAPSRSSRMTLKHSRIRLSRMDCAG